MLKFVLLLVLCISFVFVRGTPPNLGGSTGLYGSNETDFHFWCHDPTAGTYQYTYIAGFGYGNITAQSDGTFVGEGIWVSCGTIGRERITISGDMWTSTWWYKEEGDTTNPGFLTMPKLPSQGNPITLMKAANDTSGTAPNVTAETCWWLNQGIDTTTVNLGGSYQDTYISSFCLVGNMFVRGSYNGTDPGSTQISAGYFSGVNVDNIGATGNFVEVHAPTCLQGCDIIKLVGDGNELHEKFWCTLDITRNLTEPFGTEALFASRVGPASTSINETDSCFFAVQPQFGYVATPLANATFP